MKLIDQLIRYFLRHGALSTKQIDYLQNRGFHDTQLPGIDSDDLLSEDQSLEDSHADGLPLEQHPLEKIQEQLSLPPRRFGGGRQKPRGDVLRAEQLVERLQVLAEQDDWAFRLEGLVRLAGHVQGCSRWFDAVVSIRNADAQVLLDAMCAGLAKRDPPLDQLWQALGMREYRKVCAQGERGPAVAAFRRVMAAREYDVLGKYRWILKEPAIRQLFNLRQAKRLVLRTAGVVYERQRSLISRALREDFHREAYWSFLLVYNARRDRHANTPDPEVTTGDYRDQRLVVCPQSKVRRAWLAAMIMDPDHSAPYLLDVYEQGSPDRCSSDGPMRLLCPIDWPLKPG